MQLQQVIMNLIVNGVDAMHDVDAPRELIIKSQPAENNNFWCRSAIPAWDCPDTRQIRSLMPSLPPRLTAPAWDFASAAQSSNRMAAACGLPTTLRAAQVFVSPYPPKPRQLNDAQSRSRRCSSLMRLPLCVRSSKGATQR